MTLEILFCEVEKVTNKIITYDSIFDSYNSAAKKNKHLPEAKKGEGEWRHSYVKKECEANRNDPTNLFIHLYLEAGSPEKSNRKSNGKVGREELKRHGTFIYNNDNGSKALLDRYNAAIASGKAVKIALTQAKTPLLPNDGNVTDPPDINDDEGAHGNDEQMMNAEQIADNMQADFCNLRLGDGGSDTNETDGNGAAYDPLENDDDYVVKSEANKGNAVAGGVTNLDDNARGSDPPGNRIDSDDKQSAVGFTRMLEPPRLIDESNERSTAGNEQKVFAAQAKQTVNASNADEQSAKNIGQVKDEANEGMHPKIQDIAGLKETGFGHYAAGAYRESVLCYTEAIEMLLASENRMGEEILAALYSERSSALMMVGAYSAAYQDCESCRACKTEGALWTRALCHEAQALLKLGYEENAQNKFECSLKKATDALRNVNQNYTAESQDIFKQIVIDANNGLEMLKKCTDKVEESTILLENNGDKYKVLDLLTAALEVMPGRMGLHMKKIFVLNNLKRWADLGYHCEWLAAQKVKMLENNLAKINLFRDASPATFEQNPDDTSDPVNVRTFSPEPLCDAVLRLPDKVLPLYLRSLRLEERYEEADQVLEAKYKQSEDNVSIDWLASESKKLGKTRSYMKEGLSLLNDGNFEEAAEKFELCLVVDNGKDSYNASLNKDAGGRLHAVLHHNRAECLIELEKYEEAVEECTAALHIHTYFMDVMLRRGECFAMMDEYQKAIADYEKYNKLVLEARFSVDGRCSLEGGNVESSQSHDSQTTEDELVRVTSTCKFNRPIDITHEDLLNAMERLNQLRMEGVRMLLGIPHR